MNLRQCILKTMMRLKSRKEGIQDILVHERDNIILSYSLKVNYSNITMRRALRDIHLIAQVQQKKPFLTYSHLLARLRFAHMYANWTIFEWKCVFFNNEITTHKSSWMILNFDLLLLFFERILDQQVVLFVCSKGTVRISTTLIKYLNRKSQY